MLEQKRERDAGIVEDAVHTRAHLGAMREHLGDPVVGEVEAEGGRVDVVLVDELRGEARSPIRKPLPASSHASLRLDGPQQDGDGVGLVVVGRTEPARADRSDHRGLVGVALSGNEALDGADRHALVGDATLLAPGGQRREQTAVDVRRVSAN